MKYALAIFACIVIYVIYTNVAVALGVSRRAVLVGHLFLFPAWVATWRGITKSRKADLEKKNLNE